MTLRPAIIALILTGTGFVVGLPLGRMGSPVAAGGPGAGGKSSQPPSAIKLPTSKKHARSAAGETLVSRLCTLHEREASQSFLADWTAFDATAAEWLNARSTAELGALAVDLSQAKKGAAPAEVLRTVFMHWARRDAGPAWKAALAALPEHRADAVAACLLALSVSDHLAALRRLESIADEALRRDAGRILIENAERFWQPETLARQLSAMQEDDRPKGLFDKVILSWASHHLRPAVEFVKSLPQTDRERVLGEFCGVLAYIDGEEARRLAATIQDPKLSAEAWKNIVACYDEVDPDLAASVMESLPLEQMDPRFFDRRSNHSLSPEVVGRIASRLTGKSREAFLHQTFEHAFMVNGRELQAQLDAIELWPEDGKALSGLVRRMMRFSPGGALAWAQSLPESPLRDHVLADVSDSLGERDRLRAVELAAGVQDEALRTRTMRSQIESWLQNDRAAALAWLRSADENLLPAEERTRWLRLSGAR